jgi:hypothetical protein
MGIEPTALAWEARVLPLYDTRMTRQVHARGDCIDAPSCGREASLLI